MSKNDEMPSAIEPVFDATGSCLDAAFELLNACLGPVLILAAIVVVIAWIALTLGS